MGYVAQGVGGAGEVSERCWRGTEEVLGRWVGEGERRRERESGRETGRVSSR